jgi:hypothetical protein
MLEIRDTKKSKIYSGPLTFSQPGRRDELEVRK